MKIIKKLFCMALFVSLCFACSNLDEDLTGDLKSGDLGSIKDGDIKMVTVPFKTHLSVYDHSDYSDDRCGGYPNFFLTMIGEGNISHLGLITTTMTFCCNVETGVYGPTDVTFIAANGDELYAEIPIGYILPNEGDNSDFYQNYFDDPMYFTGGTGRFEGASGEGMTNAFVHDPDPEDPDDVWHTDFFSTGKLILVKGKR